MTTQTENEVNTLDGLCFIGQLVRIERKANKDTGELYPFGNAFFKTSTGEERIELAESTRGLMGKVHLKAWDKLTTASPGTVWQLSVGYGQSEPNTKGRTYVNFTAIDAVQL